MPLSQLSNSRLEVIKTSINLGKTGDKPWPILRFNSPLTQAVSEYQTLPKMWIQSEQLTAYFEVFFLCKFRGHGGRVVTLSPPTSEAGVRFPERPQVEKLVVASVGRQFTVHNPSELYVLVSSALPTTRRDMTCTVLKAT